MPTLIAGIYGLGSRDFRPEHTIGAYEYAIGKRARRDGKRASDGASFIVLGVDHPYEVKSDDTPSLLPDKAIAVRFHSVGGWGAITTGKNLGAIIGDLNDLLYERDKVVDEFGNPKEIIHVSANPKLRVGEEGRADVLLHDRGARAHPRQLRPAPRQRRPLLRSQGLHAHQPARRHGRGRKPRVGIGRRGRGRVGAAAALGAQADHRQEDPRLHAARLQDCARSDRPRRPAAPHAGQRVPRRVLLGRRRCCTEFGITPEQFRDAVHKQYMKKFGKLGDAVVISNMEVMTKGFELVREIKVGEMEAADRLDAARQGAAADGHARRASRPARGAARAAARFRPAGGAAGTSRR